MATISIDGIASLGTVLSEEIQIDNKLISLPRPLGSTDNNTAINLFGKQRTITISGSQNGQGYLGGTPEQQINAFIADIEAWVNAEIQTGKTYFDSFGNQFEVLSAVFRWSRTSPGTRILYVLSMVEGGALAAFNP